MQTLASLPKFNGALPHSDQRLDKLAMMWVDFTCPKMLETTCLMEVLVALGEFSNISSTNTF
jgi:hypothetical protein